jgi:3-hydroxyacyl-CoA dehydrogenase/enoyl-CoA hydratase/3-hydroxybutyryl-CoA epimerase
LVELQLKKLDPDTIDVTALEQRLLAIQALESARCIEEEVVTDVREADVGSILGFGFAPFTGGTISYIDGMGAKAFVDLCNAFAMTCGDRFKPSKLLLDMAKKGDTFYGRFPPEKRKAVA